MLKLGVAIGMARAFMGLEVDLARIFELVLQEFGNGCGAHLVALLAQFFGEFGGAFRYPFWRANWITHCCRLGKAPQIRHQARVAIGDLAPTTTLATNTAKCRRGFIKVLETAPDGRARRSGNLRYRCKSAASS